ncbi:MAG: HDOD domain-containing protein [Bryobacterales bacterium]|nr:HDOD domain-containing protein [Bryobacterales bacterium]
MSREQAVESRLGQILQRGDVPALPEHIQELAARLANPDITVRELGPIMRKDIGLAVKVIRIANSASFNRSGRPIISLPHAAALIGLEAMRDMITPLLTKTDGAPRVALIRPVAGLAILDALHTRAAAVHLQYSQQDDAYLCGLFRGLGELLVAGFFPAEYLQILRLVKDSRMTESVAAIKVLHCTLEDLGQAAARAWNLPQNLIATMHSEPLMGPTVRTDQDRLRAAVSFGHELTAANYRVTGAAQRDRLAKLFRVFGRPMNLKAEDVERFSSDVWEQARHSLDIIQITEASLKLEFQIATVTPIVQALTPVEPEVAASDAPPTASTETLSGQIAALAQSVQNLGADLEGSIRQVLYTVRSCGLFDRAVFLLTAADHSALIARIAEGDDVNSLVNHFKIGMARMSGPAGSAILARRDLIVYDGAPPTRDWSLKVPACFGVFPIVVDSVVAGCMYVDRKTSTRPLPGPDMEALGAARKLIAQLIAKRRSLARAR